MSKVLYNKRRWLNMESSHYTGSLVCFDGIEVINQGKNLGRYTFVEISDCHGKVRIHKDSNHSMEEFTKKLKLLEDQLRNFREYLEQVN